MSEHWEEDDYEKFVEEIEGESNYQTRTGMNWEIEGMTILIKDKGELVMKISLGEAIESTHRYLVESHIKEIERSPWIKNWHDPEI